MSPQPDHKITQTLNAFFIQVTLLSQFTYRFFAEVFKPRYEFNETAKADEDFSFEI